MSETAQYSMLMSARDDKTGRTGATAVHRAKGQPVTGSVDFFLLSLSFISLTCCLFISSALPPPPSSSPGQLRQISRTHSHRAVIYPDSTLRLVFCFLYMHLQKKKNADHVLRCILSISCCRGEFYCRS